MSDPTTVTPETLGTGDLCRCCGDECERGDRDSICSGCRFAYDMGRREVLRKRFRRLTASVLEGIIAATEQILAGPQDGDCKNNWGNIGRANAWARDVRDGGRSRRKPSHG